MTILRVNVRGRTTLREPLPAEWTLMGGRGLTATLLDREVPGGADPLGRDNKLIFAVGPLAGTGISSSHRLSAGGKSPLTGGIKEANAGGLAALHLARLGLRAVVAEDLPEAPSTDVMLIEEEGARFVEKPEYRGLGNYELTRHLREDFGTDWSIISIGPAGEMGLSAAGIAVTDLNDQPNRFAARGGLGAVMGAKGLKAVLVSSRGKARLNPKDPEGFRRAVRAFNNLLKGDPRVENLKKYGTAATLEVVDTLGALPTRNFSAGTFEGADQIGGEHLYDLIMSRGGGTPTEACMPGCVIQCSNVFPGPDGKPKVAPLEYETLCLLGSNLGLNSLDDIADLNYLCNDLGLDTIEVGGALGVVTEAGLASFGDGARYAELVREIGQGTVLGRLIGHGAYLCGRVLGVRRVPVAKKQALSAYDPRGVKGTGVTYATSPMGADHTAGLTVFAPRDHADKEGQVDLSLKMQITRAAYDALGLCAFLLGATGSHPEKLVEVLNAAYGTSWGTEFVSDLGRKVLALERAFNRAAGMGPADDRLPEFFSREPLSPRGSVFDITGEELDAIGQALDSGLDV